MPATGRSDLSDIRPGDWVDHYLPRGWRAYARLARLDRSVGIWLTLFPCWAALIQAAHGLPPWRELAIFSLGAVLMRSAGSTLNDIADRNVDGHVERTRLRPLASGQLGVPEALGFLAVELALTAVLLPALHPGTRLLAVAVLPLVVVYPFCKRFTYWPQAVLGAAFNWGMLMAWMEIAGNVPWAALAMWAGAIAWQIGYDTVYAYVDRHDDARLGLKSTARLFGRRGRLCIGLFYVLAVGLWLAGGLMAGMSEPYVFGLIVIAVHLGLQVRRLDLARPQVNYGVFFANILTGLLLAGSALIGVT